VLLACAVLCVLELAVADPLHPGMNLRRVEPRDVALDRFLNDLPPATSVATQEEAYTHLALFDPGARLLPESPDRPINACYVLIDRDFPASARLQEYGAALSADVLDGRYVRVVRNGEIELYRSSDRRCH